MLECFDNSLSTEPVKRPEQYQIELPLRSTEEQALELPSIGALAAGLIDVLADENPAVSSPVRDELPELTKLIPGVLSLVGRARPCVAGNSQSIDPSLVIAQIVANGSGISVVIR